MRSRPEGRRQLYRFDPAGVQALRDYLDRMWTDALAAYARSFDQEAT